ncbi:phytosulfokines isoform X1 [Iris pallida]|uniref:Phytosulfokines isoform X1 n=1 Tax=Iris pallida TaxID=29817 RepID=A0AAX6HYR4_IRIPA|nr:phytosulfokines isoform X1 [Iris pallida]KAJ6845851.1 phytosulfokines isoform X1 [Iris pallida]
MRYVSTGYKKASTFRISLYIIVIFKGIYFTAGQSNLRTVNQRS